MTMLLAGFHPSFDALSAVADQSDVDAARTRVGRHVGRCAQCTQTVHEIRALGDEARAAVLPGAPAGLWARIERVQATTREPVLPVDTRRPDALEPNDASVKEPTPHLPAPGRRAFRVGALALAAAAVIAAVLLVPRGGEPLHAGARAGRWHLAPERPVPGQAVTVRFEPSPTMKSVPAFMLLGWASDTLQRRPQFPDWRGMLQDSLGVLARQADGTYSGRFVFPATSQTVVLSLFADPADPRETILSTEGPVDRAAVPVMLAVAGDARGRPSLGALTLASELWGGIGQESFSVPDTLIKYFPAEPIGYATAVPSRSHRLLDDMINYFKRGERQYLRFDGRFMAERTPSAAHEVAMVTFANRIDEPGEARKWARRLATDHPEDPRALEIWIGTLRGALARPNTVDSVRRDLSLADTLWERNGHRGLVAEAASVAGTVHDTAAYRRWIKRAALAGERYYDGGYVELEALSLGDPALIALARSRLQAQLATPCTVPSGRYPRWVGVPFYLEECARSRTQAYESLSEIERRDGHATIALALADSAVALWTSTGRACSSSGARAARGAALLALHDTAGAIADLAGGVKFVNWQENARRDSIGTALSGFIPRATWNARVDSARAEQSRCMAAVDAQRTAQRDSARRATGR